MMVAAMCAMILVLTMAAPHPSMVGAAPAALGLFFSVRFWMKHKSRIRFAAANVKVCIVCFDPGCCTFCEVHNLMLRDGNSAKKTVAFLLLYNTASKWGTVVPWICFAQKKAIDPALLVVVASSVWLVRRSFFLNPCRTTYGCTRFES